MNNEMMKKKQFPVYNFPPSFKILVSMKSLSNFLKESCNCRMSLTSIFLVLHSKIPLFTTQLRARQPHFIQISL